MPSIEILSSGRIDERESAFPQAVQLPNGDILCSFNVGGGAHTTGGSDWARSLDKGETWTVEGTILPKEGTATNALKLSISSNGRTIYAYGPRNHRREGQRFGEGHNEPILCKSEDNGKTWSKPVVVSLPGDRFEISHGVLPLHSGRILAPAATLESEKTLGKQVLLGISDNNGDTWEKPSVAFEDSNGVHGYFEQKFEEIRPGLIIGTCWTHIMEGVVDVEDHFVLSRDNGLTWSEPKSTGVMGQTMTTLSLGKDRLLVMYNRRYGQQGIVMLLVTFTEDGWTVHHEGMMYDPSSARNRPQGLETGVDEFAGFEFGFPTAIHLNDNTILATNWSKENGKFGVRWTKLRVIW